MKNRVASLKLVRLTAAIAVAAVVCFLLYPGPARAGIEPTPFVTGLVGITDAQTARLNAVNVGDGRVAVDLLILDGMGEEVIRSMHVLGPRQSASLMLPGTATVLLPAVRGQVSVRGSGVVVPTLEVVDVASKKTELLITGSTELLPAVRTAIARVGQ